jgi:hypothetical protein
MNSNVRAIIETLCSLDFTNTSWVVDLGYVNNGGTSTSTKSMNVSRSCRNGRTKNFVFYAN